MRALGRQEDLETTPVPLQGHERHVPLGPVTQRGGQTRSLETLLAHQGSVQVVRSSALTAGPRLVHLVAAERPRAKWDPRDSRPLPQFLLHVNARAFPPSRSP